MQKDFHFYAIYVLCRCNGMSPENSKIVAYASQHTDDAKYEHALNFENGGRFQQVLSAHKFLHPEVFSLDSQYKIYIPFHFIPGDTGGRFQERLVCKEDSEISKVMASEVSNLTGKPYQLHRLGIALHTYADTWSHQDFSGLQTELNDVEEINVKNEDKTGIASIFTDFFRGVAAAFIPQVGHAEAAYLPDEPYRHWTFHHVYQNTTLERKNWLICRDACGAIYQEIKRFLSRNPEFGGDIQVPWGNVRSQIRTLFRLEGNLEDRCGNWVRNINESQFGFECQPQERDLSYDDREWFRQAVEVIPGENGQDKYNRRENFHISDWKHFHVAAASHRFFVLQELLSPREIICG